MKTVILDSYTVNHSDISWDGWKELGEFEGYDRTPDELIVSRLKDTEVALTNTVIIDAGGMAQRPCLKYSGVLATGYNVVDLKAASERGIVVTNIPAYSTMSVAQMVFAHVLNITTQVALRASSVRRGDWETADDFSYSLTSLQELEGKTFAIVGLGNTGTATARIAQALGMHVLAMPSKSWEQLDSLGIEKAESYEQLFRRADVLSLHCPLTDSTHHLVNRERLALMKPTAILINTGRGPLVDEQALADALNEGRIQAAGLDVLKQEPPVDGSPLIHANNCHITPHIAWASFAARKRLLSIALENVKAFMRGTPQNQVNK